MYSSVFLRYIGFFFLVLQSHFFSAQELQEKKEVSTINVGNGTTIFSTDESFNQQLLKKKIKIKGSHISYKGSLQKLTVSNTNVSKSESKSFANEIKDAQRKKEEKDLRAVKKQVAQHEKQKTSFPHQKITAPISSHQFFKAYYAGKNCSVLSSLSHKFSNINAAEYSYAIRVKFDGLHSQKYNFYNNKCLDYCYAKFYSVRPPPVLI